MVAEMKKPGCDPALAKAAARAAAQDAVMGMAPA